VAAQPKVLKKHSVVLAWLQSEANERCARAGRDNFAGGPWHSFQSFGVCTRKTRKIDAAAFVSYFRFMLALLLQTLDTKSIKCLRCVPGAIFSRSVTFGLIGECEARHGSSKASFGTALEVVTGFKTRNSKLG
jgi:hypothetical protein